MSTPEYKRKAEAHGEKCFPVSWDDRNKMLVNRANAEASYVAGYRACMADAEAAIKKHLYAPDEPIEKALQKLAIEAIRALGAP